MDWCLEIVGFTASSQWKNDCAQNLWYQTVVATLEVGEHLNRKAVDIIPSFIFSHSNLSLLSSQHSNRRTNFRKMLPCEWD